MNNNESDAPFKQPAKKIYIPRSRSGGGAAGCTKDDVNAKIKGVGILGDKATTKKCKDINNQKILEDKKNKLDEELKDKKKKYNDNMLQCVECGIPYPVETVQDRIKTLGVV